MSTTQSDLKSVLIQDLEIVIADSINTAVPILTQEGMVLFLGAIKNLINYHAVAANSRAQLAAKLASGSGVPNPAPIVVPNPAPIV